MKRLLLFLCIFVSDTLLADLSDCQGVFVGRIKVEKSVGLSGVVFLNAVNNASGSYWVGFSGWSDSDRKEVLSMLMTAKVAGHRVNVETEESNACGIQSGFTNMKALYLATN